MPFIMHFFLLLKIVHPSPSDAQYLGNEILCKSSIQSLSLIINPSGPSSPSLESLLFHVKQWKVGDVIAFARVFRLRVSLVSREELSFLSETSTREAFRRPLE